MLKRNRPAEALAMLCKLPETDLKRNDVAVYHALALAGVDRKKEAMEIAARLNRNLLLPEELELLAQAGLGN